MICLKICTFVVSATTPYCHNSRQVCCDLLENLYLCGISNNIYIRQWIKARVVICLKICTFVVSATTRCNGKREQDLLWFAWKFVPLWYQQQPIEWVVQCGGVVICLKICTFVVSATTIISIMRIAFLLWFAWKFVPLWYQQQLDAIAKEKRNCCDLLENLYLCGISNNYS